MLSGFECDEDQTGWLAGVAVWATGAAAGCLLASSRIEPALLHWQVLALAVVVSLVSLGLRLPVMLAKCPGRVWLVHALWMLAFFAQVNWAGFLAARSATGTIAAEAFLVCLGLEAWLLIMFVARGDLPWLQHLFSGKVDEPVEAELRAVQVGAAAFEPNAKATSRPTGASLSRRDIQQLDDENEELCDVRRELVDGIDENGQRYLSGLVRVQFDVQQRSEEFVLSFCPALDGVAQIELECDSEDVTAHVEHATETGARVTLRRKNIGGATTVTVEWFATASANSSATHSMNLP